MSKYYYVAFKFALSGELMGPEVILGIVTALLSLVAGGLASIPLVGQALTELANAFRSVIGLEEPPKPALPYSEKLKRLTTSLSRTSEAMDNLLQELTEVAKERHSAMEKIENDLQILQSREKELQERIEQLQNVPLPVVEHFAKLTSSGEKRSARRDYVLFGAGVVVSTVIAIILRLLGLG